MKNRKTKQLFNTMRDKVEGKPLVVDQIAAKMMAQGVAIQAWVSHFVIAPPLIVTKEELDLGHRRARRATSPSPTRWWKPSAHFSPCAENHSANFVAPIAL